MASSSDPQPEPDRPSPRFVHRRRVEFAETDLAGIVHFSMFFRYMEEAEHAMWRAAGLSIAPPSGAYGFPRVSAAFDYRLPLRFEDEFEVRLSIDEAGSRSIRYRAEVVRGTEVVAVGTMTMVCVGKDAGGTMKAIPIPDDVRKALRI